MMRNEKRRLMILPSITFFGALALCLLNIIAAVMGASAAVDWLFGVHVWGWLSGLVMVLAFLSLILFWMEAGLSGGFGMAIFWAYVIFAPFTYLGWGLPLWAAIGIAVSPVPFYWGMAYMSDKLDI